MSLISDVIAEMRPAIQEAIKNEISKIAKDCIEESILDIVEEMVTKFDYNETVSGMISERDIDHAIESYVQDTCENYNLTDVVEDSIDTNCVSDAVQEHVTNILSEDYIKEVIAESCQVQVSLRPLVTEQVRRMVNEELLKEDKVVEPVIFSLAPDAGTGNFI